MKSKMETKEKLNDLLKQVAEIVPTMLFIGTTADRHGVMFLNSPDNTDDMREADIVTAVCMMMTERKEVRAMLFTAVSWFMQYNPKYQEAMQKALDNMQYMADVPNTPSCDNEGNPLDPKFKYGHQRTAEPE